MSEYNDLNTPNDKYPRYKWTVTGIPLEEGEEAPFRREIESWFRSTDQVDKDQVNLFVLALSEFQKRPENDPNSYFMIAGRRLFLVHYFSSSYQCFSLFFFFVA